MPVEGRFDFIVERVMKKTPEETRQSLVRAGVLTEDGQLTEHYRQGKKSSAKKSD